MVDHFLGALKQLERRSQNNILIFSDALSQRLDNIALSFLLEPVASDNDYMKLLEMYYRKYTRMENKDAMLFCLMRMQQIAAYKTDKRKRKKFPRLEFQSRYDDHTKAFLVRKRNYYDLIRKKTFKQFLMLDTILYMLMIILFVLGFKLSFKFSLIFLLIIWFIFLLFDCFYCMDHFYEERASSLMRSVDDVLRDVDRYVQGKKTIF